MELVWDEARLGCYFKSSPGDFNVQPTLRTAGPDCMFFRFCVSSGPRSVVLKFECASESHGECVKTHVAGSTLRVSDSAGLL